MTAGPSLTRAKEKLEGAIAARNWVDVDLVHQRLSEILVEAVTDRAIEQVDAVKSVLASAFAKLVLLNDISIKPSAERAAWSLNSVALIAEAAIGILPPQAAHGQQGASDKILDQLARSNIGRLTNKDLAQCCGLAEETVARTLPRLISENKVKSWKSGRARFTEITENGRLYLQRSKQQQSVRQYFPPGVDRGFVVQSPIGAINKQPGGWNIVLTPIRRTKDNEDKNPFGDDVVESVEKLKVPSDFKNLALKMDGAPLVSFGRADAKWKAVANG